MKKLLCLIICACLMSGCLALSKVYTGNCVSQSLFRAHAMERQGYQVRIAVMTTDNPNVYHAQAQALINGQWQWLDSDPAMVYVGEQDMETEIVEYRTIETILKGAPKNVGMARE